jgi:formiminotetrahydrofolate cyclodeaminase
MDAGQRLDLHGALEALASAETAPAAGSAAALVGAVAAAVTVKVARISGHEGHAAQAIALQSRLVELAPADADALAEARKALAEVEGGETGDPHRDFRLGVVLNRASGVPLEIAEACTDVSSLAAELSRTAEPDTQADAAAAAVLAAAAAHAAVRLVEVNLAVAGDDPRAARARALAKTASEAAQWVPGDPGA